MSTRGALEEAPERDGIWASRVPDEQHLESNPEEDVETRSPAPNSVGRLTTDRRGIIRWVDEAAARLLQVPRKFLTGKPLVVYIAHSTRSEFIRRLNGPVRHSDPITWATLIRPRWGEEIQAALSMLAGEAAGEALQLLYWQISRGENPIEMLSDGEAGTWPDLQSAGSTFSLNEPRTNSDIAACDSGNREQPTMTARTPGGMSPHRPKVRKIDEGHFVLNQNWEVESIDPSADAYFSRHVGMILGRTIHSACPPLGRGLFLRHCTRAMQKNLPSYWQQYVPGLNVWWELYVEPQGEGVGVSFKEIIKPCGPESETCHRNHQLSNLNLIQMAINSLDLDRIMAILRQYLSHVLGIPHGAVFLSNESLGTLDLRCCWGLSSDDIVRLRTEHLQRADDGEGFGATSDGVAHDLLPVKNIAIVGEAVRTAITHHVYVPLRAGKYLEGVMDLFSHSSRTFARPELPFFRSLGQQIGGAIRNAVLYQQLNASRQDLESLSHRLIDLQERERRSIACDLHDQVGQILTGLKLILCSPDSTASDWDERRDKAVRLVDDLLDHVRDLSMSLRPLLLDDMGLVPALLSHFERFTDQTGIVTDFRHNNVTGVRFAADTETTIFRVVQEALTNCARHAGVEKVQVMLWADDCSVQLRVADSGVGFDVDKLRSGPLSSGISGMRERVAVLGGEFSVESAPAAGCSVNVDLPVTERNLSVSIEGLSESGDFARAGEKSNGNGASCRRPPSNPAGCKKSTEK